MAGKVSLQREVMDLAAAVRRCVATLSSARRFERHALDVDAAAVWIHADPTRIDQVVLNLLDNAAKYTPAGGRISVHVSGDGRDAVVEVRDDGIGIVASFLPRIFEPFIQSELSRGRTRGGLGIGLSVARSLAEMHGGALSATSDGPGTGSVFTLRLPLVAEPAAAPPPSPPSAARPRRIMLVEGDRDTRTMLAQALTLAGHEVTAVENGRQALEADARARPDVAIIDVGLRDLSGYEVARRLRQQPGHLHLVAMTGYSSAEEGARCAEAGFDAQLSKPVDPGRLSEIIGC
jgi:CheY-like chemotaxis protein/anti-sigma regulatory factor (Ser/Thr protein kinase)